MEGQTDGQNCKSIVLSHGKNWNLVDLQGGLRNGKFNFFCNAKFV